MNITFLGTAAGSSYPLAFCNCDNCCQARSNQGKDLRKRSSIIVDDDLLIDMGPDAVSASLVYKKSMSDISVWLQTHAHSDHFDPQHLCTRVPEFEGHNISKLQLFASGGSINRMSKMLSNEGFVKNIDGHAEKQRLNLDVFVIKPYEKYTVQNYEIIAFPANHDPEVEPLIFALTKAGKTLLYAADTDYFNEKVWDYFIDSKITFDIIVMDHTYGFQVDGSGHMNADRFIDHVSKFKQHALLAESSRIFATHISHKGNSSHDILSKQAKKYGYEIAYDGLTVEI